MFIDLSEETKLLQQAYENCYDVVKTSAFFTDFASRKLKHSLQVLGAGNYIIAHSKIFKNRSAEFIKIAKIACLLHDIGRFREIELLFSAPNSKHDHSLYSYEILQKSGYSDLRILLPIKQHGHLEDALDNDAEFQNITATHLKDEIRIIYQLVKDADKIANFHNILQKNNLLHDSFSTLLQKTNLSEEISELVWNCFQNKTLVPSAIVSTIPDRILQIACMFFEIYYPASFTFLSRHHLIENLYMLLKKHNLPANRQREIEETINAHIQEVMKTL